MAGFEVVGRDEGLGNAVAALASIQLTPEYHDQDSWRCATGMCFAGWVVNHVMRTNETLMFHPNDASNAIVYSVPTDHNLVGKHLGSIAEAATAFLGYDPDDVDLFEGSRLTDGPVEGETGVPCLFHTEIEISDLVEGVADAFGISLFRLRGMVATAMKQPDPVPSWLVDH